MDGLMRAGKPSWVFGVLALILAMLFGATIGAPTSPGGTAHQLLAPPHHEHGHDHGAWSGGAGDEQQPLMLHADGEQVETPEATGHAVAPLTGGTVGHLVPAALAEPVAGVGRSEAPDRSALQVWRT